jgi:hypothetical protein
MKIYGVGIFHAPGSSRVVWDFIDGPFDTVNPVLVQEARKQGLSFSPIESNIPELPDSSRPKDTPKKRGPKPKGTINVNA